MLLLNCCRKIYWNDWEYCNARIESANMDGSDRQLVIRLSEDYDKCHARCNNYTLTCLRRWPNQMELNYTSNELYWVDGFRDTLESVGIDGNNSRILLHNISHCFGLGLDSNDVYYTSWQRNSGKGYSLWKWHNSPSSLNESLRNDITGRPMDVAIVRKDVRPTGTGTIHS